MRDTVDRFSKTTLALHWLVAIVMIIMLISGIIIEDFLPKKLPDGSRNATRGLLMMLHKSTGVILLGFAVWRVVWRFMNGWPTPSSAYKFYEKVIAKVIHWMLLIGTLLMPISGIAMNQSHGRAVKVFDLFQLPTIFPESEAINMAAHNAHGLGSKLIIAAIILHIIGALKHHFVDKDTTLKRMVGTTS